MLPSSTSLFSSVLRLFSVSPSISHCDPSTSLHRSTSPALFGVQYHRGFVDGLPDEILCEIFLDIVTDGFKRESNFTPDRGFTTGRAPWNIAAVCSNWRRVCLANAKLWSFIILRWHDCHPPRVDEYDGASVMRTYLQLERSRSFPLHIDGFYRCRCRSPLSMLRAVGKECRRWKSVTFHKNITIRLHDIQNSLPPFPELPLLETLGWQVNTNDHDAEFICPFTALTNLRSAKFTQFGFSHDTLLPWNQLTHLDFDNLIGSPDDVLDTISQCAALTDLRISVCFFFYEEEENYAVIRHEADSIIHPNLASIDFTGGENIPGALLPYLRLPNLRRLVYPQTETANHTDVVLDLIERSSCSKLVTELEMQIEFEEPDVDVLKALPHLQSLSFRDMHQPYSYTQRGTDRSKDLHCNDVLRLLAMDMGSGVLCPKLQHLALHNIVFDPVLLIQVVESRCGSGDDAVKPLRSITASICDLVPKAQSSQYVIYKKLIEEQLRDPMQTGLQLDLHQL